MNNDQPLVTFVVPCFNLGHLLKQCVDSILAQTYQRLEILIMDDCSPDNTSEVASRFRDPRVRHVRNDPNLGHLANYNKGIAMARGQYVWLISADDRLRRSYVLQRFVEALTAYPNAAYVFCPAMQFDDNGDVGPFGTHGSTDRVFARPSFLTTLLSFNSVCAPAGMVRKSYYDRVGSFPLDLPFAGDWYIWARLAFEADVVYLHEPMVDYRIHASNMTKQFEGSGAAARVRDELEVKWRLRQDAAAVGDTDTVRLLHVALLKDYAFRVSRKISDHWVYGLTVSEVADSLRERVLDSGERASIFSAALAAAGDACHRRGDRRQARDYYRQALRGQTDARTAAKYALTLAGGAGDLARTTIDRLRPPTDTKLPPEREVL